MRAETQNSIEAVRKSLELLAQRMDHETAPHRLEEFNARVEDPNLWDNPEAAQKLMRERQLLVDALDGYESIKTELQDNIDGCNRDRWPQGNVWVAVDRRPVLSLLAEQMMQGYQLS